MCVGDSLTWNAGFGKCDTYHISHHTNNHHYCDFDCVNGECAFQVCEECLACVI